MGLWKKQTCNGSKSGKQQHIDVKQLKIRLEAIADQGNIEIIQLAIQSIIDELEEK